MTKTFAIADLHGRYDLLDAAIARIEESSHTGGKIVFLGDYIDRGPESRQIIERLMQGPSDPERWAWVCLRGNHEDIMLASHDAIGLTTRWWTPNGGGATLLSYGAREGDTIDVAWECVPSEHIEWIRALPRMHVDQHRVFVHAGVQPDVPLDEQDDEKLAWMLYPEGAEDGHGERHVVHGHHQFADGPKCYAGRTDLDTFAWFTGRLVVGVFDDAKSGGPISFIEVSGPSFNAMMGEAA